MLKSVGDKFLAELLGNLSIVSEKLFDLDTPSYMDPEESEEINEIEDEVYEKGTDVTQSNDESYICRYDCSKHELVNTLYAM